MPIYEYQCAGCGKGFEHLARTLSDTPTTCPACGSKRVSKQFSTFSAMASSSDSGPPCAAGACEAQSCPTGSCPYAAG